MMEFFRLGLFGFLALVVIYVLMSIYSKSVYRENLEKKWEAEVKTGDRDAYVAKGMQDYQSSLRKKLVWLVFIIPIVVVTGLVYVINFM